MVDMEAVRRDRCRDLPVERGSDRLSSFPRVHEHTTGALNCARYPNPRVAPQTATVLGHRQQQETLKVNPPD